MALISCRNVKTKRGSMLVVLVLCKTPVYLPFLYERVYLHHGQLHLFFLSFSLFYCSRACSLRHAAQHFRASHTRSRYYLLSFARSLKFATTSDSKEKRDLIARS